MEGNFKLGPWLVDLGLNTVSRNGTSIRLAPKAMDVLLCLAQHAGETVSKEVLLRTVWPDTFVTRMCSKFRCPTCGVRWRMTPENRP